MIPIENVSWTVETGSLTESAAPYRIYNIGNNQPIKLMDCIKTLEDVLGGIQAKKNPLPMQPRNILNNYADIQALYNAIDFKPQNGLSKRRY